MSRKRRYSGTNIHIDELDHYVRCPMMYYFKYKLDLWEEQPSPFSSIKSPELVLNLALKKAILKVLKGSKGNLKAISVKKMASLFDSILLEELSKRKLHITTLIDHLGEYRNKIPEVVEKLVNTSVLLSNELIRIKLCDRVIDVPIDLVTHYRGNISVTHLLIEHEPLKPVILENTPRIMAYFLIGHQLKKMYRGKSKVSVSYIHVETMKQKSLFTGNKNLEDVKYRLSSVVKAFSREAIYATPGERCKGCAFSDTCHNSSITLHKLKKRSRKVRKKLRRISPKRKE